jgi:hypothetical protein
MILFGLLNALNEKTRVKILSLSKTLVIHQYYNSTATVVHYFL